MSNLNSVWGSGPDDIWITSDSGAPLHYDGSTWSAMPSLSDYSLQGVWGSGPDDVWIAGNVGAIA